MSHEFLGVSVEELRATIGLAWPGCARGSHSGDTGHVSKADINIDARSSGRGWGGDICATA